MEVFLVTSEGGRKAERTETRASLGESACGEVDEEHDTEGVVYIIREKMGGCG